MKATPAIPEVHPTQLQRYPDAVSLWQGYPHGYRLTAPLLPAGEHVPIVPAALVEHALAAMDLEELIANARPR